jgi:hypothetical protein
MKSNKVLMQFVYLFIAHIAAAQFPARWDPIICIGPIQYDSLKRTQIKSTHVQKSIQMYYIVNKNDSLNLDGITNITYNEQGYIVCIVSRQFQFNKFDSTIISYDSFNRFKESIKYDSIGSISSKSIWTFDSTGRRLEHISWSKGPPEDQSIETSEYDSLGNCIRDSSDGIVYENSYDKNFRRVGAKIIHGNDTSYAITHYSNDSFQDTTFWLKNGKVESCRISKYDNTGRPIETIDEYFSENYLCITEKIYDDNGMTEKINIVRSSGISEASCFRRYTPKGYICEEIQRDGSNNIKKNITNTFDHNGNIIIYDFLQNVELNHSSHTIIKWYYQYYE